MGKKMLRLSRQFKPVATFIVGACFVEGVGRVSLGLRLGLFQAFFFFFSEASHFPCLVLLFFIIKNSVLAKFSVLV